MPTEIITNIYLNYGMFGLIVIAFFCLLVYVLRTSKEREKIQIAREDKLYAVVDAIVSEWPGFRAALEKQGAAMEKQGEAIARIENIITR